MDEQAIDGLKIYLMKLGQEYLPKVAGAILILILGWWLIGRINNWFSAYLRKRDVDESIVPFLSGIVNFGMKILLLVSVTSLVGIPTTSFVAILGAAGLAVGLALQGSLANFAGGVLILLFKPFKIGDLIESDGVVGTVQSITVLNTIITTPADNTAILPNGQVANNKVLNYTKENNRRVDLSIGIAYDADVELAKKVITEALSKTPKVLQDPAPFVGVDNFGDSSVNLAVRPYCRSVDYWDVYFACNEAAKKALDDANIEIPFPHMVQIKK